MDPKWQGLLNRIESGETTVYDAYAVREVLRLNARLLKKLDVAVHIAHMVIDRLECDENSH